MATKQYFLLDSSFLWYHDVFHVIYLVPSLFLLLLDNPKVFNHLGYLTPFFGGRMGVNHQHMFSPPFYYTILYPSYRVFIHPRLDFVAVIGDDCKVSMSSINSPGIGTWNHFWYFLICRWCYTHRCSRPVPNVGFLLMLRMERGDFH